LFHSVTILIAHSKVSLSAFAEAFDNHFFLSSSIAKSISQLVATNAFLHSIIQIPVLSLNSFTSVAVISILNLVKN